MAGNSLQNQVAIVTGAGQGIGFEICRYLAREGVAVVLNDVDAALAENAALTIQQEKGRCIAIAGDASDLKFITQLVEATIRHFGKLTIAVANAGITLFGDFLSYPEDDFKKIMKVNLGGSFFLAQAAARQMTKQGAGGRILFMSSVTGHQAHKNLAAYGMSKAALEMLAKTLVVELSPHGITVNAVAPGATLNERTTHDPEYTRTWSKITPLGKPATTEDIAHAVLFLVSPHAGHITGQTLVIDGGWSSVSPSPYEEDDPKSVKTTR